MIGIFTVPQVSAAQWTRPDMKSANNAPNTVKIDILSEGLDKSDVCYLYLKNTRWKFLLMSHIESL